MKLFSVLRNVPLRVSASVVVVALLMSVVLSPLATYASSIFSDGFEAPTGLGNWTAGVAWNSNSSAHSGSKSAHVNGGNNSQTMEKTISTAGFTDVAVSFWYKADSLEDGDKVEAFYSTNGGSTWTEITSAQIDNNDDDDNWHSFSYSSFPGSADNNADFKFRFKGTLGSGSDKVWIDDFALTGTLADATAPTVTVDEAAGQTDPTDISPINFAVVFSEAVTGFDASDVTLSGSAGATTKVVTGSGTDWNVAVSGMTGNGTVTITVAEGAAEDGSGNDSLAPTNIDNTVTYHVNEVPTADNQNLVTNYQTPLPITLTGSDTDGPNTLTYEVFGASFGSIDDSALPNVIYTPNNGHAGDDSFEFRVYDGKDYSANATVSVHTNSPNDPDPEPQADACVVVSDEVTLADGSASVATFVHNNWTHDLEGVDGAKWIWNSAEADQTSLPEEVVFTRSFSVTDVPTSATLQIASDNQYEVLVNGVAPSCDGSSENNFGSVESCAVTLQAGNNDIVFTVTNALPASTYQGNPAGLIYRIVAEDVACGEPVAVENSCILPDDGVGHIAWSDTSEANVQEVLDGELYTLDADADQTNTQSWSGSNNTLNFTVKNLEDDLAANRHVFGYIVNGGSFVPVFKDGVVVGYEGTPLLAEDTSMPFSVAHVNDIVFAIYDGPTGKVYATDKSLNDDGKDHTLVFNPSDNEYVLSFEDLPNAGDTDYNDLFVSLSVDSCEDSAICEPGVELLKNGGFEAPSVTDGSGWDIFASGTANLDWVVEWFGGSANFNSQDRPLIANAEFHGGVNGWLPSEGTQYAELDADWDGHANTSNGEPGAVEMSQDIETVPGETYTVSFDFSARPGTTAEQNQVEVLANGTSIGTVGPLATAGNQTEWTSHSFTFEADSYSTTVSFRDIGTPNDSLGTFIDNASATCNEPVPTATLVATKIVCADEADLPNWGAGGANITETTASNFLQTHPTCHLEPDWQFQWVTDEDSNTNPGDNIVSPAPAPWSLFGPTAGDGTITTKIPAGGKVWVREVLKDDYVPFTGANTDQNVSAEIYCSTDVLNYDNWDWVDPVVAGETYYCVAFNAPTEDAEQCNPEASHVLLSSDNNGEDLLTLDQNGPASLVSAPHLNWFAPIDGLWIWKDIATSNEDADAGTTEIFTRTFEVLGTPFDSTLTLAVDNGYTVKVNGNTVCTDAGEHNYESTVDCAVPASDMHNGTNTITFEVVNIDHPSANDPSNNPAGLYYKLVVNENECVVPETATIIINKQTEQGVDGAFGFIVDTANENLDDAIYDELATTEGYASKSYEVTPGEYEVTEVSQENWTLYNLVCDWTGYGSTGYQNEAGTYTNFTIEPGQTVTCTFYNSYNRGGGDRDEYGTLIIKKLTSYAEEGTFDFIIGGYEDFDNATVVVNNGVGQTSMLLPTGTYSLTEVAQEDWEFTGVTCEYEGESEGVDIEYGEQITIGEDETVTCTFLNSYDDDSGGGGHINGGPSPETNGAVLGAVASEEQSCSPLLDTYMRLGINNDATEVSELQAFLNGEMGTTLPLTGVFGPLTDAAVRAFQLKYWEDVLQPWFGFEDSAIKTKDDSTGYVYKTTRWKINDIFCAGSESYPVLP